MDAPIDRETERSNLDELIRAAEAEHGPITESEVKALREQLKDAHFAAAGTDGGRRCLSGPSQ